MDVRVEPLNHKEGWVPKNWCFRAVVLEKTLESPLDSKEIKPVNPKGNQPWIFIGWTDAEAETSILWPTDANSQLIRKDPDAGKNWGREVGDRGWNGWMVSPTQWTWVWANSGRWWRTGKPGMLQSVGVTESDMPEQLNWTDTVYRELSLFVVAVFYKVSTTFT